MMVWVRAGVVGTVSMWAAAGYAAEKALDHDAYDVWRSISGESISADGEWVEYTTQPQDGDPTLHVVERASGTTRAIDFATGGRFSRDSSYVVFTIEPSKESVLEAKRAKKKGDALPKDGMGILNLASGAVEEIEGVRSFALPKESGQWIAYHLEKAPKGEEKKDADSKEHEESLVAKEEPAEEDKAKEKKKDKTPGTELVVRPLGGGAEHRFADVTEYRFNEEGTRLGYAVSSEDAPETDGVYLLELATGEIASLKSGEGNYKSLRFDESGTRLAFLSDADDYDSEQPDFALYLWRDRDPGVVQRLAVAGATPGIPEGWWVSEHRAPSFSKSGARVYFGTAPIPPAPLEEEPLDEEVVKVDVWNWRDPLIQPMQLARADDERKRTYLAVAHTNDGRVVQLADATMPDLTRTKDGEERYALGESGLPYAVRISWDSPGYDDVYRVNVETGERVLVLEALQGSAQLSPTGRYIYWWDRHARAWYAHATESGRTVCVSERIDVPLYDERNDRPMTPGAYGLAGWTDGDTAMLIYDRHDIWMCDPAGFWPASNLTNGVGRDQQLRFRYVDLDREEEWIPGDGPLLLSAFDYVSRASGFYHDRISGAQEPSKLVMEDFRFGTPSKAEDGSTLLFTRESFRTFPDLWTSDNLFKNAERISHANPQQAEYRWGSAELVSWRSAEGVDLEGILAKPDDFDPEKKYPLMVYFYERLSDGLHRYESPQAERASINTSFYVSRGYLVFKPDIPYEEGYPGESALNAIVPGVLQLLEQGFVDHERIACQGHSWGGYQVAYLVTRTNLFAAAEAGAPVSNMTSAYGGIRWSSGMSRMFQYEKTQSRIGGTLWERPLRYIDNSPLFMADNVETPLLMMHNDDDGAVPWYQGIELFVALRRLNKPVWMLNYNGEQHGLTKYRNKRDWTIRMQQFFDHYLLDAPAPVWMAEGVPAVEKGRTMGLELVDK